MTALFVIANVNANQLIKIEDKTNAHVSKKNR